MFVSRTRAVVPFHRPSPVARMVADLLGSSPAVRVRGARRRTPTHWPAAVHASNLVAALPSSHTVPTATGVCAQPLAGLQESTVQVLPSSQFTGACVQPVAGSQASVVQALPSLHVTGVCVQPVSVLQPSTVQAFPSSQLGPGPRTHTPPEQVSPTVHALASLQPIVLLTCWHPSTGSQESVVQTLPSLQLIAAPRQVGVVPAQTSGPVQTLPSLQAVPAGAVGHREGQHAPLRGVPTAHG